jgi:hypothetical protein
LGSLDWQEAFVAMSAVLGEPLDATLAALDGQESTSAAALVACLRSASQSVRAEALARVATEVAKDLERMRLR